MNRIGKMISNEIKKTKQKIKCYHLDMAFPWPRWGHTMECRQHHISIHDVITQTNVHIRLKKRFERVTGEMFTLLQHRFWLQLDNVSRISISCNSCIRHCHHISKCFLFEWIKVCATALQEWWCLRWLDIDSGPQCGIPTYPSPASYWYIVIYALSILAL